MSTVWGHFQNLESKNLESFLNLRIMIENIFDSFIYLNLAKAHTQRGKEREREKKHVFLLLVCSPRAHKTGAAQGQRGLISIRDSHRDRKYAGLSYH